MLVEIVGNDRPVHHYLEMGSIAYVEGKRWVLKAVVGKGRGHHRALRQAVSNQDCRRIPHNKANLRAFAKQQKHFYKKAK